jgi:hypothetical protein
MKIIKSVLFLSLLLALSAPLYAQKPGSVFGDEPVGSNRASSRRLDDLSERLAREAENLSDNIYRDYTNRNGNYNNRTDLEGVFLAEQFNASADLFYKMVRDRRPTQELRQSAGLLQDFYRRAGNTSQRNRWNEVQRTLDDISRELNGYGGGNGNNGGWDNGRSGQAAWRGTVDDYVQLVIRDDYIEVRTLGGQEYFDSDSRFSSPLPRRRVGLSVNKVRGRGDIRVVQQPSANNGWEAIIEIRDKKGGADQYEVQINWQ